MSQFIVIGDYNAAIHQEILDGLIRSDEAVIEIAEDEAIEEMKGYMSQRYDTAAIFSKLGDERNKLVLMMAIDIVLYHLHSANNPMRYPEIRKDRYKRAVDWLKMVQAGEIIPDGLPLRTVTDGETGGANTIAFYSQPKRVNAF